MKPSAQIRFDRLGLITCLLAVATATGQKQSKTYKETFNVSEDAVVDINTSHADIEFETWDSDQVVIEAVVELEGASEEEAQEYFEHGGIEIMGNSDRVEIRTRGNGWQVHESFATWAPDDFSFNFNGVPGIEPFLMDLDIPEIPPMPEIAPLPPMAFQNFDYEAYKKDGEKYMKQWKKDFDRKFDEEYRQELEEWSERVKAMKEERVKAREAINEERERLREEQEQLQEELHQEREAMRQNALKAHEKRLEKHQKRLEDHQESRHNRMIIAPDGDSPHIFYRASEGENRNFKVRKTIRIKMPKATRLKLNVRHGEVKLAENARNINANLAYASLLARTIDGEQTDIRVAYSPVTVLHWNYGNLKTEFSEDVDLREVTDLILQSNASDVTINRLLKRARIENDLGLLRINSVAQNFEDMNISVRNGELFCELPASPFKFYLQGTSSTFAPPSQLTLNTRNNQNSTITEGYHLDRNADKSIVINSKFSDVVLEK